MNNPLSGRASKGSSGGGIPASEAPPEGNHPAVCLAVIDLGTQPQNPYQGQAREPVRQIFIAWELSDSRRSDGSCFVVGQRYTLSFNLEKAALVKMMQTWRGKKYALNDDIDPSKLPGKPCLLLVEQRQGKGDTVFVNVVSVAALPRQMQVPQATRKPFCWWIGSPEPPPTYPWLPACYGSSVEHLIRTSPEWQALTQQEAPARPQSARPASRGTPQAESRAGASRPRQSPPPQHHDESDNQQAEDDFQEGGTAGDPFARSNDIPF